MGNCEGRQVLKGIKNDRVVVLLIDNGVEVHKFVSASDVRLMPETDLNHSVRRAQ